MTVYTAEVCLFVNDTYQVEILVDYTVIGSTAYPTPVIERCYLAPEIASLFETPSELDIDAVSDVYCDCDDDLETVLIRHYNYTLADY